MWETFLAFLREALVRLGGKEADVIAENIERQTVAHVAELNLLSRLIQSFLDMINKKIEQLEHKKRELQAIPSLSPERLAELEGIATEIMTQQERLQKASAINAEIEASKTRVSKQPGASLSPRPILYGPARPGTSREVVLPAQSPLVSSPRPKAPAKEELVSSPPLRSELMHSPGRQAAVLAIGSRVPTIPLLSVPAHSSPEGVAPVRAANALADQVAVQAAEMATELMRAVTDLSTSKLRPA